MTDKNVEGAESGTKVSEYDMTKMIEILSQQGKYKILTREEYELLSQMLIMIMSTHRQQNKKCIHVQCRDSYSYHKSKQLKNICKQR
jgi:hypothetical protein